MSTHSLPLPGLLFGDYPERRMPQSRARVRIARRLRAVVDTHLTPGLARYRDIVAHTDDAQQRLAIDGYQARARELRALLARDGFTDTLIAEAFALIRRTCRQTLGIDLHSTQLVAARILLDNRLAEMATGEGKTLAAALCAATAALAGIPVHVVTANDYLVARDRALLAPLYEALGLSVGQIVATMDVPARRRGYDCDVTYCTAKELVFDYLRDRTARDSSRTPLQASTEALRTGQVRRRTLLRGLCMAVLDEADSILLDEARTPLILSRTVPDASQEAYQRRAWILAQQLDHAVEFTIGAADRQVQLTASGRSKLDRLTEGLEAEWHNRLHRDEAVCTALAALHVYERERHYLVRDGKVVIVDEVTGRPVPGRVWSRGLHALVELKEGCDITAPQVTAAQITYQRFFPRYLRLCGMSGTVAEARAELASTYALSVSHVRLRVPSSRRMLPARLFGCAAAQRQAVVARVRELNMQGRPVLVGADSVIEAEALSAALRVAGVVHRVLDARSDSEEAGIVAQAGEPGAVTVATNMAGRGTDIKLGPGVAARGGLHVLSCQHNASRRIDRQLVGRCARQGDPGSAERFISLEQRLLVRYVPRWLGQAAVRAWPLLPEVAQWLFLTLPQWIEEHRERQQRSALQARDARIEAELELGARGE